MYAWAEIISVDWNDGADSESHEVERSPVATYRFISDEEKFYVTDNSVN